MDAIRISRLFYSYPTRSGPREVLRDISLSVSQGEIFGFLGPNGSGKTTLFKILSTLFPSSPGAVEIFGQDAALRPDRIQRRIGVVFQQPSLDRKLTTWENLWLQGRLYGLEGTVLKTRVREGLRQSGLQERPGDLAEILSGGLQRRLEIAKSLIHRPEILLMDEPSSGLDPGARKDFWNILFELKRLQRTTLVLATHLLEEAERCDRLAILNQGRVVALGAPEELKSGIGKGVISISTPQPESLIQHIREKFGDIATVVDGTIRIEKAEDHGLIPQLLEAFPGQITSVTLSKPNLEDVFIHRTGHKFLKSELQ